MQSDTFRRSLIRVALLVAMMPALAWSVNQAAGIVIDYPLNGSVFAPDMESPTFLWRDPATSAVAWRIDVAFANGSPELHLESRGEAMRVGEIDPRCVSPTNRLPTLTPEQAAAHTWKPDAKTWASIKRQSAAGSATITISGFAVGDLTRPVSLGSMQIHLSTDPVGAPIFYRDVPLMPSKQKNGAIKPLAAEAVPLIAWRNRNGAQATTLAERAVQLTSAHNAVALGTLAAAYAEAGRFDQAIDLAVEQGNEHLTDVLRTQLD